MTSRHVQSPMELPHSSVFRAATAVLAWLGRQGTRAIAAVVLIGIAVPPLGAVLRPFVTPAIFVLLCIAFLRVDAAGLRSYVRRPHLVLAATAWTMLAVPLLFGTVCLSSGLDARAPELFLALMMQAVAPPMMAAPAFAALMGFDATLVLAPAGQTGFLSRPDGKDFAFVGQPVRDDKILGSGVAFGIRKGDDALRQSLNAAIEQLQANGTVTSLARKYFGDIDVAPK